MFRDPILSLRRGYRARCNAAVVTFNNSHPRYLLHKRILQKSPTSILKKFEERRRIKRQFNKANPHKKNRMLKKDSVQNDYGTQSTTPDLRVDEMIKDSLALLNIKLKNLFCKISVNLHQIKKKFNYLLSIRGIVMNGQN